MTRTTELEAAAEELARELAIMPLDELRDYFFNYLAQMYTQHPNLADQEQPRQVLVEFFRARVSTLEAALQRLEEARRLPAPSSAAVDSPPWPRQSAGSRKQRISASISTRCGSEQACRHGHRSLNVSGSCTGRRWRQSR
jgi:hypothetical protein